MAAFDLERTYLSLDGQGRLARHPVDDAFWATIDTNADILGTLIGAHVSTADWPHFEVHPEGVEVLVQLDGTMTLILEDQAGERRLEMAPGATCVVPRGVWRRALVAGESRFLGVTYGAGATHRPV